MQDILKSIGKGICIFIAGIAIGIALITAVYALPVQRMQDNVRKSVDILIEEDAYPRLYGEKDIRMTTDNFDDLKVFLLNTRGTARDNITDALMLNLAVIRSEENPLRQAMINARATYAKSKFTIENLTKYLKGKKGYEAEEYSRYWHGYLVLLKPLLLVMSYEQIRWLNVICMTGLLAAVLIIFYRKGKKQDLFLWLYSILFTVPIVIPFCMQYCTVTYVMLFAMLFAIYQDGNLDSKWLGFFFLVVGMVTSYVDFLTFPLMGMGLPLVYLLNQSTTMEFAKKIKKIVLSGVTWAVGYVGMWASKWVIASVVLGENLVSEAVRQVAYRSSSTADVGDFKISPFMALASNLSCFTNVFFLALIALGLTGVLVSRKKMGLRGFVWQNCIPYICICAVPFAWAMLYKNHSYGHGSFTYRMFTVTIYGGMSMLLTFREKKRKDAEKANVEM